MGMWSASPALGSPHGPSSRDGSGTRDLEDPRGPGSRDEVRVPHIRRVAGSRQLGGVRVPQTRRVPGSRQPEWVGLSPVPGGARRDRQVALLCRAAPPGGTARTGTNREGMDRDGMDRDRMNRLGWDELEHGAIGNS